MLKIFWILLCSFLIFLIILRTPENTGLSSFAEKTNLLGSPSSTERTLNIVTMIAIVMYCLIAIQLDLSNMM